MPPITPDRWRALSPYLDQALEISTVERAAWLASIRVQDPALAADLQMMLAEHDVIHESRFLERAVLDPRVAYTQSLAGQVLGSYRLVSLIGQGGSGSVWLGERCDDRFQGFAAIKLLNISLVGRGGEGRFRREGTILARLRHPRIAHIIDAGVSPAGQPYLILEHVDGQSIDQFCDERGLGIEARLRLFLDVLDAVAHAHANLIVHRDIKPANVLVSKDGQVKLLDFGIAKLIEPGPAYGATGASDLTREVGAPGLTPEYAAPEQLSGGAVTTATDVYALGVLLYVLLSGQHPAGDAIRSRDTLVRAILATEPPRVSDAATPRAGRLRRTLRGDLDAIAAKALRKDAAERYPSVTALADDLRRFLLHEPISARPNSVGYRAARFARRHAGGIVTFAAVVLLIATMTTVHARRLSAARDHAQREAEKAIKVSELLMGLLTSADPYQVRATQGEPTAREMLDAGADQVQKELSGQPELQAAILTMMGRTYRRIGAFDKAQQLLEQALAGGERAFGADDARVAQTIDYLGVVLADKGNYSGAAQRLEQSLAMRRRLIGPEHPDVAVTLSELGRVYQDQGSNGRAEPLHREALAIRQKVLGDEHQETAVSLSDLASVLRLDGNLSAAEMLLRHSLETNRKTRGDSHPNTSATVHDLALISAAKGDYREAESQLRRVLADQRKALGDRHPVTATTLNSLARVLRGQQRYDEAAAALGEARQIAGAALGNQHQLVAIYTLNLAAVELARKNAAAAEPLAREGLRVRALAPGVVPSRRRTLAEDDWSLEAAKALLLEAERQVSSSR